jgi:apolipoprotein N-acyltransferase
VNPHVVLAARVLAVAAAAACLSLLAPPANWHWLHWVVYLPMFWALREETPRSNRWLAFLYGTLGVGLLFRWIVFTITIFSPIPAFGAIELLVIWTIGCVVAARQLGWTRRRAFGTWVAAPLAAAALFPVGALGWLPVGGAIAILALFSSVFGLQYLLLWPAVHPMRRWLGPAWVFVFPAWEVVLEWGAMQVFLFPYNHGVSQYHVPYTWQLASVTGVWGLSYLVFLVNAALAEVMFRRREGRAFPFPAVGATAGVVLLVLAYGAWRYERVTAAIDAGPTLRVAQIQSDKGMEYRMTHSARSAFEEWLDATRRIPRGQADLVVWPEGACPYDLNDTEGRRNMAQEVLSAEARRGRFEMVVGGGTRLRVPDAVMGEDRVQVFNSVYFFEADGTVQAHYDKMVPLPFGEYLPFGSWFPDMARTLNIGDFRAGEVAVTFEGRAGRIATPICYEAILPSTCYLFRDADLLVVVTNDAWFGDSANPHQHAMLASTRAMELGIPMFRSAYTGVSFVVDPAGRWSAETEPFEAVERIVEVPTIRFQTLYSRLGDWFVWLCIVVVLVAAGVARSRAGAAPLVATGEAAADR